MSLFFFFNDPATTEIYTLSLHDALPILDVYGNQGIAVGDFDGDGFDDVYVCQPSGLPNRLYRNRGDGTFEDVRSEEHTSELQSLRHLVCRLLLEKKKKKKNINMISAISG